MAVDKEISFGKPNLDWINPSYIEKILNKKNKSFRVMSVKTVPAIGKGDNYSGIISRAFIEYESLESKQIFKSALIIKTAFVGDQFVYEKTKEFDLLNKEINIYETVLPRFTDLMNEINDEDILFPATESIDHENSSIVFEDLNMKSFLMADRTKGGLDAKHTKLALQKLAKLHALSAVVNERTNGSLEKFDRGMFNRYTNSYSILFENNLIACSDMIKEFGGPFIEYSEKLKKLRPHLMEYGKQVFDVDHNDFNVLAHGDFWINNLMFKYNDKNELEDAIVIDFQYSSWGSPGIDLHYFLNTAISKEFTVEDQEEFIKYYYYELVNILRKLNFSRKIPSLHEFWLQILGKGFYGFMSACLHQPVMLCEETADADIHALIGEDERAINFRRSLYKNKKVQNILKKIMPIFDRRGLLDVQS